MHMGMLAPVVAVVSIFVILASLAVTTHTTIAFGTNRTRRA